MNLLNLFSKSRLGSNASFCSEAEADSSPYSQFPLRQLNLHFQACNLTCPMCCMNLNNSNVGEILRDYPGASHGRFSQLTLEEYKNVFTSVAHFKPSVSIGGGEPMIFPYMVDLVEFLTGELGLNVGMTTNGTLFTDEMIERFSRTGAGVTISVDGMKETHDEIRGVGNFDKAINVLEKFVELKRNGEGSGPVAASLCIHQPNYKEMSTVAKLLLEEVGVDNMSMSMLVFSTVDTLRKHAEWQQKRELSELYDINIARGGGGVESVDELSAIDFEDLWEVISVLNGKYQNLTVEPNFHSLEDLKKYFLTDEVMPEYFSSGCRVVREQMFLLSNGDIMFAPQCFQVKCGNIRETEIHDIWNGQRYMDLRKHLASDLSPVCSHCCGNRIGKETALK